MKFILTFFIIWGCLPVWGQLNRKSEIEKCTELVYSAKKFRQIADSLQMTINELSDYPIIFPMKKPLQISSGYGMRHHPIHKVRKFHTGIDIPRMKGTIVYATGNGIVIRKGYSLGYGNYIEIRHAGNFRSFYAHLSQIMVNVGDSVSIAVPIGCVGNTGLVTGSHLHYEVRKGKRFLSPAEWCNCLTFIIKENKV